MRHPRGLLRLALTGRAYRVEVRFRPTDDGVDLELIREDCKPGPRLVLPLDEARALQKTLQAACDEAHRRARERHRGRSMIDR